MYTLDLDDFVERVHERLSSKHDGSSAHHACFIGSKENAVSKVTELVREIVEENLYRRRHS
jgi:hypothetical protein